MLFRSVAARKYQKADEVFADMKAGIDLYAKEGGRTIPSNDLDWVIAMIKLGKGPQAYEMTQAMIKSISQLSNVSEGRMTLLQAFDAMALHASAQESQARKEFDRIMPKLLDRFREDSENLIISTKQQTRMTMILEDNLSLLAKESEANPQKAAQIAAQAFSLADLARGSSVQRALNASAARANIKDPELAALARKEQDMQRRIATLEELLTGLLAAPPEQQLPAVQARMKTDIEQ